MKFTIRDLRWLTVVVALGVGWWLNHFGRPELIGRPKGVIVPAGQSPYTQEDLKEIVWKWEQDTKAEREAFQKDLQEQNDRWDKSWRNDVRHIPQEQKNLPSD